LEDTMPKKSPDSLYELCIEKDF
ncbi:hypothetical protein CEXT_682701, partial [Caerostris extrusa]